MVSKRRERGRDIAANPWSVSVVVVIGGGGGRCESSIHYKKKKKKKKNLDRYAIPSKLNNYLKYLGFVAQKRFLNQFLTIPTEGREKKRKRKKKRGKFRGKRKEKEKKRRGKERKKRGKNLFTLMCDFP